MGGKGLEAVEIYSEKQILTRVGGLAREVKDFYGPINNLLVLGVLTGSVVLMADFMRALGDVGLPHQVAFMGVESQGDVAEPRITLDLQRHIRDKQVLLSDELIDTGKTFDIIYKILAARRPISLEVLSLFVKEGTAEVDVPIRFAGLPIPNVYVEGYGLDNSTQDGRWRRNLIYWRKKGGVNL